MVKINWTNESKYWLKHIHSYIATDNPKAAKKVIQGIHEQVDLIKIFPEIGYKLVHISKENIRIILYGHYRIAYLIKDKNNIDILAVIHGRMDISQFFKNHI